MLDSTLQQQLKEAFLKLSDSVTLRVAKSNHPDQEGLMELLQDVVAASAQIRIESSDAEEREPCVDVIGSSGTPHIRFRGVPGGHEFSSLVLAILNANGKGKLPDSGVVARIQALKGPIRLRTFVSLTCENCPEVVQALNQMALIHPDFHHETIDGAIAPEEVKALGIQGVPSVIHEGRLVHSGKAHLTDLLAKLESAFGKNESKVRSETLGQFDVVVVGGGPAGASAAIYSARKGLKTALIADRFGGQLQETKGIENMISISYTEGTLLSAQLADHLSKFPVQLFEHRWVSQISGDAEKRIQLDSGEFLDTRTVIIATGAQWRHLGIPGEKEHIGQGVAFCAHCDGPFYKGKRVAVVGGGNSGVEAALDLAGIAEHVTLLEYGQALKADQVLIEKLQRLPNARILVNAKSVQVIGNGSKVSGLEYEDLKTREHAVLEIDGIFVQIGLLPNSEFVKDLIELTARGEIVVDEKGRTNVPGIYAAGDVTTVPFKQIVVAMGEGAKVALAAFEDRMHASS